MVSSELKLILETILLAAGEPMSLDRIQSLFPDEETQPQPSRQDLRVALLELAGDYTGRGIELVEVAGGYRIQVRQTFSSWASRLWEERSGRYSRALLETLALIAYRQPITRGEIAEIRGVSVNTNIIKTLQERNWIKVIGHREVPGRPAIYGTTRTFLDYFNLQSLGELPPLSEPRDLEAVGADLGKQIDLFEDPPAEPVVSAAIAKSDEASIGEPEPMPASEVEANNDEEDEQKPGENQ